MPANPSPALILRSLFLSASGAAMLTALIWAAQHLWNGRPLLPSWPKPPRIVPWGPLTVILVIVTWVVVNASVALSYVEVRSHFEMQPAAKPARSEVAPTPASRPTETTQSTTDESPLSFMEMLVLGSVINGILLGVLPIGLRSFAGAGWDDLGLTTDLLLQRVKIGSVAFLIVTPLVMTANGLAQLAWKLVREPELHPLEKMIRESATPISIAVAYVSAVVLAPMAEELIFRGVFQGWLRRVFNDRAGKLPPRLLDEPSPLDGPSAEPIETFADEQVEQCHSRDEAPGCKSVDTGNLRRVMPIVLTSVFFAAVHYEQMPAPLALFPLSLALGLLYETTGSLVPSIVLHALFNGFNTTVLLTTLLATPPARP